MTHSLRSLLDGYAAGVAVSADTVRRAGDTESALVVLDDDPTGTQSVSDLPVLTHWGVDDLAWALGTGAPAVYIMTNSRSLEPTDAAQVNSEVVAAALTAAGQAGRDVRFASRSDSTLRGHFPLEPATLAREIEARTGRGIDGILIVPAFGDAGRITVGGVHYAGSASEGFLPVGETDFAKDATFGYSNSVLAEWVEEKSNGAMASASVIGIGLNKLRTDHDATVAALLSASNSAPVIVDIVTEDDLRLLALAIIAAESQGARFLYRVGPPFVRALIGQEEHPPLTHDEIEASRGDRDTAPHGLVIVGSHVPLTTRQLDHLSATRSPREFEIDVPTVLGPGRGDQLATIIDQTVEALDADTVVLRTSRTLVRGEDGASSLEISRAVSAALVDVVRGVLRRRAPRFVIAKGGITSSDIASKGLGMRRARVVGPMLPGIVSLWSGEDGPGQGIPYVVFAGNVGDDTSLATVVDHLTSEELPDERTTP